MVSPSSTTRPRSLLCGGMYALLVTLALPASAIPISINTSSLTGTDATLSITLFDGDFVGNNTAKISNLQTDGMLGAPECSNGCNDVPPITLDESSGFGEFLQALSLGTFISFDLTFTNLFDPSAQDASPDLVVGELLDSAHFRLLDTELDSDAPVPYRDALFVANLSNGSVLAAQGITTVPEPASLALFVSGLALLSGRRLRSIHTLSHPLR